MISGPFGTLQSFSAPFRLAFWLPVFIVGGGAALFIRIVLRLHYPAVAKGLIETATVAILTATFGSVLLVWSFYFSNWVGGQTYLPSNGMQLLYLALIAGSFLWLRNYVIEIVRNKADSAKEVEEVQAEPQLQPEDTGPRILRRLPEEINPVVLYLAAEDHFVAVHTQKGVHRLRMRFKDAIDEMEGVDGFYTHRSYWVNRLAITRALKHGSAWRLQLICGKEVPVSRKYQPELEAEGLLRLEAAE